MCWRISTIAFGSLGCALIILSCWHVSAHADQRDWIDLPEKQECATSQQQVAELLAKLNSEKHSSRSIPKQWLSNYIPPSLSGASLRPQIVGDGISDYVVVNPKDINRIADNSGSEEALRSVPSIALLPKDKNSNIQVIKRHMDEGRQIQHLPINHLPINKQTQSSWKTLSVITVSSALTTVPVVDSQGGEAPAVVIEAIPEPKKEVKKPEQLRTKPIKKYHGFSGFMTLGNRQFESGGFNVTTGVSYKPIKDSYWFVRSSVNYRFEDEKIRYTWGIGYDDWHPGTVAFQLNHWGPLLPGDNLDTENAIASLSYKFNKNEFMKNHRFSSSITFSQKISGDPTFSWSNSWNPKGKWFVRSTITQPIKGGATSWSYGFGYANYSPFTFSFEYNNWGYNKTLDYNFKDNGLVSLTYRWRY